MQQYVVEQFDADTFIVADSFEKREICICGNYKRGMDAKIRAHRIATFLNMHDSEVKAKSRVSVADRRPKKS